MVKPATNLTLLFRAPSTNSFIDIANEFSTTDITVRNLTNGTQQVPLKVDERIPISELNTRPIYVEAHAPKLTHGTGSKIVLALKVQNYPNLTESDSFDASVIYDQGSTHWVYAGGWSYKGFVDNFTNPKVILIIFWTALITIVESVLLWGKGQGWFKEPKIYNPDKIPVRVSTDWKCLIILGLLYFLIAFVIMRTVGYLSIFPFLLIVAAILIVEILLGLAEEYSWIKKKTARGVEKKNRDFPTSWWRRVIFVIVYVLVAFIIWTLPIRT
jgi:hypothetical protein